jgi:hypothetical protein
VVLLPLLPDRPPSHTNCTASFANQQQPRLTSFQRPVTFRGSKVPWQLLLHDDTSPKNCSALRSHLSSRNLPDCRPLKNGWGAYPALHPITTPYADYRSRPAPTRPAATRARTDGDIMGNFNANGADEVDRGYVQLVPGVCRLPSDCHPSNSTGPIHRRPSIFNESRMSRSSSMFFYCYTAP